MLFMFRYVLDLENWVEMCMIALICTILFTPDSMDKTDNTVLDMKRHLAAIRETNQPSEMEIDEDQDLQCSWSGGFTVRSALDTNPRPLLEQPSAHSQPSFTLFF